MHFKLKNNKRAKSCITLASSFVALTAALANHQVLAQDDDTEILQEVVIVSGVRQNLQNAQDIKRQADTVVDAISAEDIGALPDRSVLEALQRIPGVSVERFAGPDDPDHFSVEGSGAIIRGMTQTRSEFNGRDSFSATSGRGLSFQDVSPELMGSVEVFKNQTADMIEGGIGGTISLNTRKPFDSDGRHIGFNLDYSYGDIAEEGSGTYSGLYSDRWETEAGEFGFLINVADSTLYGESHGIQSDALIEYYAAGVPGAEEFVGNPGDNNVVWIPSAANALKKSDDRFRQGLATSFQWRSSGGDVEATLEYIKSDAQLTWTERAIKYQSGYGTLGGRRTSPLTDTEFSFDNNGIFEEGILVFNDGWRANGNNTDHIPRAWSDNAQGQFGHKAQFDTRVQDTESAVEDLSFNLKWQITDSFELIGDVQHVEADLRIDDLVVHTGSFAAFDYDTARSTPTVTLIEPWLGARDADRAAGGTAFDTLVPGGAYESVYTDGIYPGFSDDPAGDANYFQDPNSYFWRSAMDKFDRSEGESDSIRLDGTYELADDGFVKSIKSGVRYAQREQTNRDSGYDWGSVGPEFNGRAFWLLDNGDELIGNTDPNANMDVSAQLNDFEYVDWSDFHGGGVVNIPGNATIHPTEDFVKSMMGDNPTRTLITKEGSSFVHANNGEGVMGIFNETDINSITETNKAVYVRLDFGGDDELRYSGNIGLRYVSLERETAGYIQLPELDPGIDVPPAGFSDPLQGDEIVAYLQQQVADGDYADIETAADASANSWIRNAYYFLPQTQRDFAVAGDSTDADEFVQKNAKFTDWLPSFNIKLELTDDLVGRFSFAKAVAYPDIGDVRQRQVLGGRDIVRLTQPLPVVVDPNVDPSTLPPPPDMLVGAFVPGWTGSGGNPDLAPMTSNQYDFSLEWYFDDVGQLSTTVFHKSLNDYFIQGGRLTEFTNPVSGVSQIVDLDSTINGGKAKMDGVEFSYQQFFEGALEGFGVQSTYTYIDASGAPNNEVEYEQEGWFEDVETDTGIRVNLGNLPLQGQSKHTVNLVGMFEKDGWSARLAYNWRSRYLLTTRDVISKAPLFYDDHGQLDGSVFYDITDNLTVGLQGTNLTNSQSETIMVLNNDLQEAGRSWFVADRRLALVLRGKF